LKTLTVTSPLTGAQLKVPDTGTKDHPTGLYDSNDPALVRTHLKLAERAGIDAFIVTWWGRDTYEDRAFRAALDEASKAQSPVKFTVYYESVRQPVDDPVAAIVEDFRYLREQYGNSPAFFREQGKPVFFIYARAIGQLKPEQWTTAIAGIRALGPTTLIPDCMAPRCLELADGVHEYNPVSLIAGHTDMTAHYREIVQICREKGKISAATVIPGYDDSHIGRERPMIVSRDKGGLYRRLWSAASAANPDWILITSFNEWHEGSEIEPSLEWDDLFVNLTHGFTRTFKASRR
jgi:glycoprotein endo-alpha-1,2-mannosidase